MNLEWMPFRTLTEDNVRSLAPSRPGVYLLWVKLKNGKWRCYYVGQAQDLRQRLLDHLSKTEPNACIRNHIENHISGFEFAEVSTQADRDGVEKYLYDHFSPECNEQDPGGESKTVNLP